MIKVEEKSSIKKQNRNDLAKHYTFSIMKKRNGYEARITLEIIGGGKNPRLSAFSSNSQLDAVIKLFEKIKERLLEYKISNFLTKEKALRIYDSLILSTQELKLTSNMEIMKLTNNIFEILTTDNIAQYKENNIIELQRNYNNYIPNSIINNVNLEEQNTVEFQSNIKKVHSKTFKEVAIEWFEYKLSLTKESVDNPKPLSPKTLQGYNDSLYTQILPYFKNNKNISLLTEKNFKDCIMSFNGYRNKESVYIVLKMILDYARDKGYIYFIPKLKKPKRPYTDKEETIIFIESDKQEIWLDYFEKEDTDISMLFETMLLTGVRPEEACGLKWSALNEDAKEISINNAYKDSPIYNEEYKIIGHTRGDGRLKTPESYRTIPLNDRLKRRLLEHREKQQQLFKIYKKKWNENEYMFLNQYRKPFVPENLSDNMRKFIKKYELERMTPYGLRHSFASFCSEKGMDQLVLMKIMGHSDFNTTQKYYISISNKRKKLAIEKAYESILEKENKILKFQN